MVLYLREVLEHPLILAGEPLLLSGEDRLDSDVRWVHTADLYDIAPLLRGEEVLLTNGVGLLEMDEDACRTYVRRLAQKGVSALMFEVGRSFIELPTGMAAEARRLGLPLVVLQPALRFTEVAEAINRLIIDRSITKLRHADVISRSLSEILARAGSVAEIAAGIQQISGTWVVVQDDEKQIFAIVGSPPDDAIAAQSATAPIIVDGTAWGRLTVGAFNVPEILLDALLERAPTVIALALIRNHSNVVGTLRQKHALIEQFLEGEFFEKHALADQLSASGLPVSGYPYACVVIDDTKVKSAVAVLEQVTRTYGPGLVGVYQSFTFALIVGKAGESSRGLTSAVHVELEKLLAVRGVTCAALGPIAASYTDLPSSMKEARLTLTIAQQQRLEPTVLTAKSLAIERLLYKHGDHGELRRFIDEQLGPLLEYDARRGTSLIHTLRILLECNGSKTAAAARLYLRRQSLYHRLSQITTLLEVDLDEPRDRLALSLAISGIDIIGDTFSHQSK